MTIEELALLTSEQRRERLAKVVTVQSILVDGGQGNSEECGIAAVEWLKLQSDRWPENG
ncbi:MAG: hypothetical protein H7124_02440 [Phycisphaerales bacterium]|nr:hypothetical protein [Hyphomonadaceae bacterium]